MDAASTKKKSRTPKPKPAAPEEDDIPSPNRFAVLEEDPDKSNWVLPATLKARMVGGLAEQLDKALQQPALAGAKTPALVTAVTKVLKSFVVMKTSARAANKFKHIDTVYDCVMPAGKERKAGDTSPQLLAAMASYIVAQVVEANPSA